MTDSIQIDPTNADALSSWDGDTGAFWTERADRFDEGVARYQDTLLAAAAIPAHATVLDIGCGSGQTTRDAARRATGGSVLGVDLSSSMIELARRRADREGLTNVSFLQADAQVQPFPDQHFDVVLSRHGVMFFGDPPAAFANVARSMRPEARLVLLTWQPLPHQEWISTFRRIMAAGKELPAPQSTPGALSEPDQVRELLTTAGFTDIELRDLREPMYFGRDVADASEFISGQFARLLGGHDAATRSAVLEELRASMADHHTERGVHYDSAAWLITARRIP